MSVKEPSKIAIIAGIGRVSVNDHHDVTELNIQSRAFAAALKKAASLRAEGRGIQLSVCLDHRAVNHTRWIFDDERSYSHSKRRKPTISMLRNDIRSAYEKALEASGTNISLSDIRVIVEETMRSKISRLMGIDSKTPERLRRHLTRELEEEVFEEIKRIPNCSAIVAEYFRTACPDADGLQVFIEEQAWTGAGMIQKGTLIFSDDEWRNLRKLPQAVPEITHHYFKKDE